MFTKTAGFKKLLKEAYDGPGLRMGKVLDTFCIAGGYWAIQVLIRQIPKKELAAIIELTGELPGDGMWFCARKKEANQYEIDVHDAYRPMDTVKNAEEQGDKLTILNATKVTLHARTGEAARVLQDPESCKVLLINEKFMGMVDNTQIDVGHGEYGTEGPEAGDYPGVIFRNNFMAMHIYPREDEEAGELIKYLEGMELPIERERAWG